MSNIKCGIFSQRQAHSLSEGIRLLLHVLYWPEAMLNSQKGLQIGGLRFGQSRRQAECALKVRIASFLALKPDWRGGQFLGLCDRNKEVWKSLAQLEFNMCRTDCHSSAQSRKSFCCVLHLSHAAHAQVKLRTLLLAHIPCSLRLQHATRLVPAQQLWTLTSTVPRINRQK